MTSLGDSFRPRFKRFVNRSVFPKAVRASFQAILFNQARICSTIEMPSNKAPRRHHYIPRMILRNFLNNSGGLYFWRRGFPIGQTKSTTPENLFLEDDLYTIVGDAGERDASLEHGFAKLEAAGAHFLRQLLEIVRAGKKPHMGEDAWEFFQLFHYYSNKRSAAWHSRFLSDEEFNAVLDHVANEPRWTDADRAWTADPKSVDRIKRNSRIAAQATGPTEELLEAMRSRGLAIYVAPQSAAFVLGDHPTAMATFGLATERAFGGNISFMPIASDVAVGYPDLAGLALPGRRLRPVCA